MAAIRVGNVGILSVSNMIAARWCCTLVRNDRAWNSAVSFCEQFMLAKEMAERDRERLSTLQVRQTKEQGGYRRRLRCWRSKSISVLNNHNTVTLAEEVVWCTTKRARFEIKPWNKYTLFYKTYCIRLNYAEKNYF